MAGFKYDNSGRGYHICGLSTNKNTWFDPLAKYGTNKIPKKIKNDKVTVIQTKKKKGPKRNVLGLTKAQRREINKRFVYATEHGLDSRDENVKRVYLLISFALPGQPITIANFCEGRLVIDTRLRIGEIIGVNENTITVQYGLEKISYVKKKAYPTYIKIWRFPNSRKHNQEEVDLVNLKEQRYKAAIAQLKFIVPDEK